MEPYYCDTIMYDICLVSTMFESFGGLLFALKDQQRKLTSSTLKTFKFSYQAMMCSNCYTTNIDRSNI